jgi:hypothetical protein
MNNELKLLIGLDKRYNVNLLSEEEQLKLLRA